MCNFLVADGTVTVHWSKRHVNFCCLSNDSWNQEGTAQGQERFGHEKDWNCEIQKGWGREQAEWEKSKGRTRKSNDWISFEGHEQASFAQIS
jgi:hypothetical protein